MSKSDEILKTVTESATQMNALLVRLYGEGSDKGDIPTIREQVQFINGVVRCHDKEITSLKGKVKRNWLFIMIALVGGGGGVSAITKLLELW